MTNGEQNVLWCGVAADTIVGLALGLMIAIIHRDEAGTLCRADPVTRKLRQLLCGCRPIAAEDRIGEFCARAVSRGERVT